MLKRILTASIIILFAGILVTISARELPAVSVENPPVKTTIFLGK